MSANMVPTYANIFATRLEKTLIYVSHHFRNALAWWQYIDDIFLILTGNELELQQFHEYLNLLDP